MSKPVELKDDFWPVVIIILVGIFILPGCVWTNKSREYAAARYQDGKNEEKFKCDNKITLLNTECGKKEMSAFDDGWNIMLVQLIRELRLAESKSAKDVHRHLRGQIAYWEGKYR